MPEELWTVHSRSPSSWVGTEQRDIVRRMDPLKTRWLIRITAYIVAIVVGLSVVLAAALALDAQQPEPSGSIVLLVLGATAGIAAFLGRVTYRGVSGLLSGTLNTRA